MPSTVCQRRKSTRQGRFSASVFLGQRWWRVDIVTTGQEVDGNLQLGSILAKINFPQPLVDSVTIVTK